MSREKRRLSEEEQALWQRVAKTVVSRGARATSEEPGLPGTSGASQTMRAKSKAPALAEKPPPANRAGEKRVRRGKLDVGASLDLHGHTQVSGRTALLRFLRRAQANGERVVVVITGVGRGGHGVLKQRLPEWLSEPDLRAIASGYAPAHRLHGGAGAFYVFLRRDFTEP